VWTSGDTVPISIRLRNQALIALGRSAPLKRIVRIRLEIAPEARYLVALKPCLSIGVEESFISLEKPLIMEVNFIGAGAEYVFMATIGFKNATEELIKPLMYSIIPLTCTLILGEVNQPMNEAAVLSIQVETHAIKFVDSRPTSELYSGLLCLYFSCLHFRY
jgi:hypothetical protein